MERRKQARITGNRDKSFSFAYFIFSVFFLFSFFSLHGQTRSTTDSLTLLLKNSPNAESKLELYEKICLNYIDVIYDLETAKKYADSLMLLSNKLNNKNGYYQAQYLYGIITHNQGKYNEALEYLQSYVAYARTLDDSVQLARGLYHVAVVNFFLGNYDKSLAILYRILAIEEKNKNQKKIASILNVIGGVYKKTNKFREAISCYKRASEIFKAINLNVDYGMSLQNMGNSYIEIHNYDSARLCYEKSLQIFNEGKNPAFIATVLGNLGNLYEARNEYYKALLYHKQAHLIWRQENNKKSLANCLSNLGKTFLKLRKYNEAEKYLNEALLIAEEIKLNPILIDVYSNLNDLYVEKNEYKKAHHYLSLYNQVKDSIFSERTAKELDLLQTKYETEKKDKQIALLEKDKEVRKIETQRKTALNKAFAGGLVLVILIAALAIYIFRQRLLLTNKNNEVKEADFKRQLIELEIKALRAQINPHFLFNCMNAINLMILKKENENASLYMAKFTKLVRLILENAEASSVTIESEMALVESYIQLEELRLPGKITYKIVVDDSIGTGSTYIPSMVLQPVVENAIWHGIVHKESNPLGFISIDVKKQDDQLLCTIEDNGVGRDKARQLRESSIFKNKSMGMKITEDRLRLMNRKQLRQNIQITDLKDSFDRAAGTRVILQIPIFEQ